MQIYKKKTEIPNLNLGFYIKKQIKIYAYFNSNISNNASTCSSLFISYQTCVMYMSFSISTQYLLFFNSQNKVCCIPSLLEYNSILSEPKTMAAN